jgi:ATP sulfurylase
VENVRLPNGLLFGLPVVFDTDREDIKPGAKLLLMQVSCSSESLMRLSSC